MTTPWLRAFKCRWCAWKRTARPSLCGSVEGQLREHVARKHPAEAAAFGKAREADDERRAADARLIAKETA